MNQVERVYLIDDLLQSNRFVSMTKLQERLEVKRATVNRDLTYMRDRLFAPIRYNRDENGYFLDKLNPAIARYQLPGLWFNAQEIHAILTLQRYLEDVSPKLLDVHVSPLRDKLKALVDDAKLKDQDLANKIKIIHIGRRSTKNSQFDKVAHALITSTRLEIRYYSRPRDEYSDREISPLRLVHYRENWYLDAWCHSSDGMRIFSVDAIEEARLVSKKAKKLDRETHDRVVTAGYGIFSGEKTEWATLRFSVERSRWVSSEEWHPLQIRDFDTEDRFILKVPYSDDRELIMDILKFGPDVEVLAPESLKNRVRDHLKAAIRLY